MRIRIGGAFLTLATLALCAGVALASATIARVPNSNALRASTNNPSDSYNRARIEVQEWVASPPPGQWVTRSTVQKHHTVIADGKYVPASTDWSPTTDYTPTTPPALSGREFRVIVTWYIWNDADHDGEVDENELSTQGTETSSTYTYP